MHIQLILTSSSSDWTMQIQVLGQDAQWMTIPLEYFLNEYLQLDNNNFLLSLERLSQITTNTSLAQLITISFNIDGVELNSDIATTAGTGYPFALGTIHFTGVEIPFENYLLSLLQLDLLAYQDVLHLIINHTEKDTEETFLELAFEDLFDIPVVSNLYDINAMVTASGDEPGGKGENAALSESGTNSYSDPHSVSSQSTDINEESSSEVQSQEQDLPTSPLLLSFPETAQSSSETPPPTLLAINNAPTANPDTFSATEGVLFSTNGLLDNDTDIDDTSDTLTLIAINGQSFTLNTPITLASGNTIWITDTSTGAFNFLSYEKTYNLFAGEGTTESFQYTVTDGVYSSVGTATMNISGNTSILVTNTNDDIGGGTLREAVVAANLNVGGDTIDLAAGYFQFRQSGANENSGFTGDLDITEDLTIKGEGAGLTILNAAGEDRLFEVAAGTTLILENLTLTGGIADLGGAILNNGNLILKNVQIQNNSAQDGGAIATINGTTTLENTSFINNNATNMGGALFNSGNSTVSLLNTTITGNSATITGGAIHIQDNTQLIIDNTTITNNNAGTNGDGIFSSSTHTGSTIASSILYGNDKSGSNQDIFIDVSGSTINSTHTNIVGQFQGGYIQNTDLIGVAPLLAPPGINGGGLVTHLLNSNSPAIDKGASIGTTDTRGALFVDGDSDTIATPDIGATEYGGNASGFDDPPAALFDTTPNVNENALLNINNTNGVLSNDFDPEGDNLTLVAVNGSTANVGTQITLPSGALLTLNTDGSYNYDTNNAFDSLIFGGSAIDTFNYTVSDVSGNTSVAEVTVNIDGIDNTPTAADDTGSVRENSTLLVFNNVLNNDIDLDSPNLVVSKVQGIAGNVGNLTTLASGAQLILNSDGTYTYNPNGQFESLSTDETTTDSFTYEVSDPQGNTDTATTTITITGTNDAPVASNDAGSVNDDNTGALFNSVLNNATDIDTNDVLSVSKVENLTANVGNQITLASGALLTLNSAGTYNYNPNGQFDSLAVGETATDSFSYEVTDANGGFDTAKVTITITGTNTTPIATDDAGSIQENNTFALFNNVLLNDSDIDTSDSLAASQVQGFGANVGNLITLASGARLILNSDGNYIYTPNGQFESLAIGETATDSFTYQVSDTQGGLDTAIVTITITGTNDAPAAAADTGSVSSDNTGEVFANVLVNDIDLDTNDTLTISRVENISSNVGKEFTLASGALLEVNVDGSYTYNPNGQFGYLAAGQSTTDSFKYEVTDSNGGFDTTTVTITISGANDNPIASNDTGIVYENSPLKVLTNVLLNDSDPNSGDTLTISKVENDANNVGKQITLASGALLTLNTSGSYDYDLNDKFDYLGHFETTDDTFTYQVSDPNGGTDTATVTIIIIGTNDQPIADNDTGSVLANNTSGSFLNVLLNDSDADANNTLSISKVQNSSGNVGSKITLASGAFLTLNSNGDYTYDPNGQFDHLATSQTATDSFTYEVTDSSAGFDTATVVITITGVGGTPTANADTGSIRENNTLAQLPNVLDNDTDPNLADSLTVSAVQGDNAKVGVATSTTNGGLVTLNSDGTYTYDTNGAFENLASGTTATDTFTYQITDSNGGFSTATVTLTITGTNDAPTAYADIANTNEDNFAGITANVLSNDSDIDTINTPDTLSISKVQNLAANVGNQITLASGALLTLNSLGTYAYDLNGKFDSLAAGATTTDSFTYEVTDNNGLYDSTTVTITVTGVNDAPVASDDTGSVNEDNTGGLFANVLANDTDTDTADVLTVSQVQGSAVNVGNLISLASGAQLTLNSDGTYTYNPNGSFETLAVGETATDSFTYQVSDSEGGLDTATVTITITGTNDAPVATNDTGSVSEDNTGGLFANVLANDTDTDTTDVLTVSQVQGLAGNVGNLITLASGAQLTLNSDGTYTYNPNGSFETLAVGETATDSFTYQVSDSNGGLDTATVTITITGTNDNPIANGDTGTIDNNGGNASLPTNLLTNDSDVDISDTLTVIELNGGALSGFSSKGAAVTLNSNGTFTYDPTVSATLVALGTGVTTNDTFTYTINDSSGGTDTATVTITVTGTNSAPIAIDDQFATDEDTAIIGENLFLSNPTTPDSDPDSDPFTVIELNGSINLTSTSTLGAQVTLNTDGTFTYDPSASATLNNLAASATTNDTFTYTISDGNGGTDTATVTITVTGLQEAPTAIDDQFATNEDTSITGQNVLSANPTIADSDPESDPLTITKLNGNGNLTGTSILGAAIILNTDGTFSYNPNASSTLDALAGGQTTNDTFTYTISDGNGGESTATVTITVTGIEDPPAPLVDNYNTTEGAILSSNTGLLENDTNPEPQTLTLTQINGGAVSQSSVVNFASGAQLTVTDINTGDFDFVFTQADAQLFAGDSPLTENFTYTASDGVVTAVGNASISTAAEVSLIVNNTFDDVRGNTLREAIVSANEIGGTTSIDLATGTYTMSRAGTDGTARLGDFDILAGSNITIRGADRDTTIIDADSIDRIFEVFDGASLTLENLTLTGGSFAGNGGAITNSGTLIINNVVIENNEANAAGGIHNASIGTAIINNSIIQSNQSLTGTGGGINNNDGIMEINNSFIFDNTAATLGGGIRSGGQLTISNSAIAGNTATSQGGGIALNSTGIALIENTTISGNTAVTNGGGLFVTSTADLTLNNSTISSNTASRAGGIFIRNDATVDILYSTITNNNALTAGKHDGIEFISNAAGSTIGSSIVFGNDSTSDIRTNSSNFTSLGNNVFGTLNGFSSIGSDTFGNPLLVTLQNNGGFILPDGSTILTHAIGAGSSAIDFGKTGDLTPDQRGFSIVDGDSNTSVIRDSGAFEYLGTANNFVPVANDDTNYTFDDQLITVNNNSPGDVLLNDFDINGDILTVIEVAGAAGNVGIVYDTGKGDLTLSANGSYTYTPTSTGPYTDSIQYTVSDGNGGTDTATLTIIVERPNTRPLAIDDQFFTNEATAITTENVLAANPFAADSDADSDSLTITQLNGGAVLTGTSSQGANVVLNTDGTFTYDPTASSALNALGVGVTLNDTFTYTIDDGFGGTDTATVTITVTGTNDSINALNDTIGTDDNTILNSVNVLSDNGFGADNDPDGDPITVVALNGESFTTSKTITTAQGASLTLNSDGSVTYDPTVSSTLNALQVGDPIIIDSFTYSITDGNGTFDTATVNIEVSGANDAPTLANDTLSVNEGNITTAGTNAGALFDGTLGGLDSDVDSALANFSVVGLSTGAVGDLLTHSSGATYRVNSDGSVEFDATTANVVGNVNQNITITVADGDGATSNSTLTLTVSGTSEAPVANDEIVFLPPTFSASRSINILANDFDPDTNGTLTTDAFSVGTAIGLVTLNGLGNLTLTDNGTKGTVNLNYTVRDNSGQASIATVTITTDDPIINTASDEVALDTFLSLREVSEALIGYSGEYGNYTVGFDSALNGTPILVENGEIRFESAFDIQGNGPQNTIISGNNVSSIFDVIASGASNSITLSNLTVSDSVGTAINAATNFTLDNVIIEDNNGTGIAFNDANGILTIMNSAIVNNTATSSGGGVFINQSADGTTIENSTISGNSSSTNGGGVFIGDNSSGVDILINNSTITNNIGNGEASGLRAPASIRIGSSIIYDNNGTQPDMWTTVTSDNFGIQYIDEGGNILGTIRDTQEPGNIRGPINADPLLSATFALNGGETYTHSISAGSSAINAGIAFGTTSDQRGATFVGAPDSGAFEFGGVPPVVLDLDGDGVELIAPQDGLVQYHTTLTTTYLGWVAPDDAILIYDENGDGLVSSLNELALANYHADATTDLEGLKLAFDTNDDNIFNADDEQFNDFMLWQDLNQDGISQENELTHLFESDITALYLESDGNLEELNGNTVMGYSAFERADGSIGTIADVVLSTYSVLIDEESLFDTHEAQDTEEYEIQELDTAPLPLAPTDTVQEDIITPVSFNDDLLTPSNGEEL